ncbi:alpha-2C adrenergic receptor-like [Branchiostoma lanceolatum]|uniref:alpha-2C adrenergic receptor-like n=1 Tax=Branchiostoma lanceolatum TaxID=7740 RepID=UPI003455C5F5
MSSGNSTNLSRATVSVLLQTTASVYSLPAKVAIGLAASAVMLMIIVGNILVCLAVVTERKLRHPQNWFLVSLASSDLLVGTLIMPFSLAYELMGYWAFGPVWCEIWLAMDVFACTASIFNLCLIALERYRCVVNPTAYSSPTINRRQGFLIAGAYITAAVISLPPLFGWAEPREQDDALPMCPLQQSLGYVAFSATFSFYIPLIVMVTAYICLIVASRAHLKRKLNNLPQPNPITSHQIHPKPSSKILKTIDDGHIPLKVIRSNVTVTDSRPRTPDHSQTTPFSKPGDKRNTNWHRETTTATTTITCTTDRNRGESSDSVDQDSADISKENGDGKQSKVSVQQQLPVRRDVVAEDSSLQVQTKNMFIKALQRVGTNIELQSYRNRKGEPGSCPGRVRMKMLQARERRFTLIIGLVMGAFIVCWYPFFQLYPIVVTCESCNVPEVVFKFFFWIGYCNSAANPIIYTIFNKDFRSAFLRIITCGFRKQRARGVR